MPTLAEIAKDPNYVKANAATKQAIFDKYAAQDSNYTGANAATQQAIRQKFGLAAPASAAPAPEAAEPEQPQDFSFGRMAGNVLPSTGRLLGGLAEAVLNPIDTVYGLGEAGAGGIIKALPESARQSPAMQTILGSPEAQQALVEKANALGGFYADRYGSVDQLLRTVEQDPAGVLSDASVILGGAGAALKAGGAASTGAGVMRAATNVDPVMLAARGTAAAARPVAGVTSGVLRPAVQFVTAPFRSPETTAANALAQMYGGDATTAANMLKQTQDARTTPGYQLTMSERSLVAGERNPTLAAVQQTLAQSEGPVNRMVSAGEDVRIKALQDQLARVDAQIAQQRTVLTPQALVDLQRVSDDIRAQLGAQQNALLQQRQTTTGVLPQAQLRERGTQITGRAEELKQNVKQEVIEPAYRAAFDKAADTQIDVTGVIARAQTILGRTLSKIEPGTAPNTTAILQQFQKRGSEAVPASYDAVGMKIADETPAVAPAATLKELDDVRKALNRDIAAAKASGDAVTGRNLQMLHSALDDAVQGSTTLPPEAKTLYNEALSKYRDEFAPRFKTGQTARLFRQSSLGETQLAPSRVVLSYLKDADSAQQFVTTFGKDAMAADAMLQGLRGLYRRQVEKGGVKAGDKFLEQYGPQLDVLQQAGVDARGAVNTVRQQLQQIESGQAVLDARAKLLKHTDTNQFVQSLLGNQTKMKEALQSMGVHAQDALVKALFDRAAKSADAGNPQEALNYLVKYEASIKQAAGQQAYGEAVSAVKAQLDAAEVAKNLPDVGNLSQVVVDLKPNLSAAELTDLQVLADDLSRRRDMDILAGRGTTTRAPDVSRLATEGAEAGHAGTLSIPIATAKDILRMLGKNTNTKAAQQLAHWMYKDPDAAIAALEKIASKRGVQTQRRATAKNVGAAAGRAVASPGTRLGVANAMAQEQERRNALAP